MSRSALKEVLLDLKKQMRGKRASSYSKKKDEKPKADDKLDTDVGDIETVGKLDKKSDLSPKDPDKKPDKVDFSEEIRKFMKNKRVAKAEPGTSDGGFFGQSSEPKAKKKGK